MNLSDKDYREFHDQIWDRNKELIKENKKLKQELEETEHARWLCEGNWKRCEQELEQNKHLYDLLKHDFEVSNDDYLFALRQNEELTRKNEKLSSELEDKKEALWDAINDFNDIDKENDKLLAHIRKLEKDKDDLNKELIKANKPDVVSGLNHEINRLKEQLRRQSNTICDLETCNHDLELSNECLADEVIDLQNRVVDLQNRIDEATDILLDDESPSVSECIDDLRWERKLKEVLNAKMTENGLVITINSDNIL